MFKTLFSLVLASLLFGASTVMAGDFKVGVIDTELFLR